MAKTYLVIGESNRMNRNSHALEDLYGRTLDYLRLSITDRCNLRCTYCMPEEGIDFIPREKILSYEDMKLLIDTFSKLGMKKLRFTGGEPFVRKDFDIFLSELLNSDPSYSIHITTNATLFPKNIKEETLAKLSSINISLDSLDSITFSKITRRDMLKTVWKNMHKYHQLGIPIKLNNVVQPGLNFHEIPDFVALTKDMNIEVRFIEPMPFNGSNSDSWNYVSAREILNLISEHYDVSKLKGQPSDTAETYHIKGHVGNIGIIPAYTRSMCASCNRLRINAQGILRTCLYSSEGQDLKALLIQEPSYSDLVSFIQNAVTQKKKDGFEAEKLNTQYLSMTKLGG